MKATVDTGVSPSLWTGIKLSPDYLHNGFVTQADYPSTGLTALVVPVTGVYNMSASVGWQIGQANPSVPAQAMLLDVRVNGAANGARRWWSAVNWASEHQISGSDDILLQAGDRLNVWAWHNCAQVMGMRVGAPERTYLSLHLLLQVDS